MYRGARLFVCCLARFFSSSVTAAIFSMVVEGVQRICFFGVSALKVTNCNFFVQLQITQYQRRECLRPNWTVPWICFNTSLYRLFWSFLQEITHSTCLFHWSVVFTLASLPLRALFARVGRDKMADFSLTSLLVKNWHDSFSTRRLINEKRIIWTYWAVQRVVAKRRQTTRKTLSAARTTCYNVQ